MKRSLTTLAALGAVLTLALSACSAPADTADGPITIGVTDESKDYWRTFEDLAAEAGLDVELVNFTDYAQPNPIVTEGGLDLNQFQHLLYLANYNESAGADLVPIGSTFIYQLGLYTTQGYASPEDLPDGAKVAIPNDPTNQARALLVLQSAGLIELVDGGNALSTPAEVDTEASRVEVVPVDANQTAIQVETLDAAIINNNFAADAGIDPTTAIWSDLEDPEVARPYLNVWAARAEDADDPDYATLVEIYQSDAVSGQIEEENAGTASRQVIDPAELATDLADLQALVSTTQG